MHPLLRAPTDVFPFPPRSTNPISSNAYYKTLARTPLESLAQPTKLLISHTPQSRITPFANRRRRRDAAAAVAATTANTTSDAPSEIPLHVCTHSISYHRQHTHTRIQKHATASRAQIRNRCGGSRHSRRSSGGFFVSRAERALRPAANLGHLVVY